MEYIFRISQTHHVTIQKTAAMIDPQGGFLTIMTLPSLIPGPANRKLLL